MSLRTQQSVAADMRRTHGGTPGLGTMTQPERRAPARRDPVAGSLAEQELGAPASWIGGERGRTVHPPPYVGGYDRR